MPNVALACAELEKAVSQLINRTGYDSEVLAHLKNARRALRGSDLIDQAVTDSTEASVIAEPEAELPTPPPVKTPKRRSTKR